jgi:hypothetical protein
MRIAKSALVLAGLLGLTCSTWAHEGHGMPGANHWHAGDGALYLVGVAIAAGLWLARGK